MTKIAKLKIRGKSPLSQSRFYTQEVPKIGQEKPDNYEKRTWKHRLHVNDEGSVFIPSQAFAICLKDAASHLGMKFRGNSKFSSRFKAGIW